MLNDEIKSSLFFLNRVSLNCVQTVSQNSRQTSEETANKDFATDDPTSNPLDFTMQPQQQSNWCWAAVATSTSKFYNPDGQMTQCILANHEFSQQTCCQDGSTSNCNREWYLDRALKDVGYFKNWISGSTNFQDVSSNINAENPIGVRIQWSDGSGHFVIIYGYVPIDLPPYFPLVYVADPIYGYSQYIYSNFVSHYQGNGTWTDTYYTED